MHLSLSTLKQLNLAFAILCIVGFLLMLLMIPAMGLIHQMQNDMMGKHQDMPKELFRIIQTIQVVIMTLSAGYAALLAIGGFVIAGKATPSRRLLRINAILQLLQIPFGTVLGIVTLISTADDDHRAVQGEGERS